MAPLQILLVSVLVLTASGACLPDPDPSPNPSTSGSSPSSSPSPSPSPSPVNNWNYIGCYTDNVSGRALTSGQPVAGGSGSMTQELCQTACAAAGFTISGTEYAGECWCGNSIVNGGSPATDGCTMPCNGNQAEMCGGPNRLSVYQYGNAVVPGQSAASPPPSTSRGTGKRGVAYTSGNPSGNAVFANMFKGYSKISWGYDWAYPSLGLDSYFEFVPMLWGSPQGNPSWAKTWSSAIQTSGVKNMLGFNEPDLTYSASSNMLPAVAAQGYINYVEPFRTNTTVRISTPNVLWNNDNSYSSGGPYDSRVWTQYFFGNCTGCHFDFAAIHYYADCAPASGQDGAAWFKGNVTNAYNTFRLPIWVSEFQCYGTEAQQITFLQNVMPWLDAQSWVERYAYFGAFPGYLMNAAGTGFSALGTAYATT